MDQGTVLVLGGPAGVGKSTVARLVAASAERAVVLGADEVAASIVGGFVDQWRPEAAAQNETIGVVLAVAAAEWAAAGYLAVVEGHALPEGFEGTSALCRRRGVGARYVVLRADAEVCWQRAAGRGPVPERHRFDALHERFVDLGPYESAVVDAGPPPDEVARAVLARLG